MFRIGLQSSCQEGGGVTTALDEQDEHSLPLGLLCKLDLLRSRVPFRAFAYFVLVPCSIINNVNYYNLDDCDDRR